MRKSAALSMDEHEAGAAANPDKQKVEEGNKAAHRAVIQWVGKAGNRRVIKEDGIDAAA